MFFSAALPESANISKGQISAKRKPFFIGVFILSFKAD
jgi:hypothetical protein